MTKIMMIHSNMRHLRKCRSYSFDDTISTTTTPRLSTLPPPGKYIYAFKLKGGGFHTAQFDKSIALIKVLTAIFDINSF